MNGYYLPEAMRVQQAIGNWLTEDPTNIGRVWIWLTDIYLGIEPAPGHVRDRMRKFIPGVVRNYSGERGARPFTDCPDWLFPLGCRGNAFTYWHMPNGDRRLCR